MENELWPIMLKLLAVAALLFANGFFVSVEFALVSVRRSRIDQLAAEGSFAAGMVRQLLNQTDRILAASQLGITMASLAIGWIAEPAIGETLEKIVSVLQLHWLSASVVDFVSIALAFMLATSLHIVLGEQAPKIYSIRRPELIALLTASPIRWFERLFRPFIWVLDVSTRIVLRLVGIKSELEQQHMYSVDELKFFINESQRRGLLAQEQEEMALKAIELTVKEAKAVMIPRHRIVSIDEKSTVSEFLKTFAQHPHARFPVHRQSIENITGYLRIKDVLMALAHDPVAMQLSLKTFVKPTIFVPENKRVGDLFVEMRDSYVQLAVVVEEFGGTAGIITLEEMAEEVVGRVGEALMHEPASYRVVDDHVFEVSGQMRISELNRRLRIQIPERLEYETIAGFLLYELRAVPSVGTRFTYEDIQFTVSEIQGARIAKVRVSRFT